MSPTAQRILEILEAHVSAINARSILRRSVEVTGRTAEGLTSRDLETVIPALARTMRLFVDGPQAGLITGALWRLTETRVAAAATRTQIPIATEVDVSRARVAARTLCRDAGAPSLSAQKIATAVSELARNLFRYAQGGVIELELSTSGFTVRATDRGPGIRNIEEILGGSYKSKTGMGLGLVGTKRMVDSFDIVTSPSGTCITAVVKL